MSEHQRHTTYRASPGIAWIVQDRGVLVTDELARRSEALSYPGAAVWELLCRGHDLSRVVAMLAAVLGVAEEEARECTDRWVQQWQGEGWMAAAPLGENP